MRSLRNSILCPASERALAPPKRFYFKALGVLRSPSDPSRLVQPCYGGETKRSVPEPSPAVLVSSRLFSKIARLGTVSRLGFKCAPPPETERSPRAAKARAFRVYRETGAVTNLNPGDDCRGPGFCPEQRKSRANLAPDALGFTRRERAVGSRVSGRRARRRRARRRRRTVSCHQAQKRLASYQNRHILR